jgi:hypothetical protein
MVVIASNAAMYVEVELTTSGSPVDELNWVWSTLEELYIDELLAMLTLEERLIELVITTLVALSIAKLLDDVTAEGLLIALSTDGLLMELSMADMLIVPELLTAWSNSCRGDY